MIIGNEAQARAYVASISDEVALERLEAFVAALTAENLVQNLIARDTLGSVWQRHIADSAQLVEFAGNWVRPWLDLGSGAGLPGLVISIVRPELPVVLVESRKRRVEWLSRMADDLDLGRCSINGQKLEQVDGFAAGVISARAFAPLPRLLHLSARFSTDDTIWVLPKGRSAAQEVSKLSRRGQRMFHVEQSLTSQDAGLIVGRGQWSDK